VKEAGKSRATLSFKNVLLVLALIFVTGCLTPPPMIEEPIKRFWEIEAPLERTWKASLQALVEKGVMISILDKEDHLMVVEEVLGGGEFQRVTAERGSVNSGVARVTLLFTEKAEDRTGIHINTVLQGFKGNHYLFATSNGNLEKDYYLLISNNLPIKKTYKWLEDDSGEEIKEGEETKEAEDEKDP
jgi:hypothetical protein